MSGGETDDAGRNRKKQETGGRSLGGRGQPCESQMEGQIRREHEDQLLGDEGEQPFFDLRTGSQIRQPESRISLDTELVLCIVYKGYKLMP
jgi:hypothetical protein